MTISELADQAGVTERTIRYYVEQGVLPPPERGRPAEYTDEHVRRLALIRRLKEQYLPLEEIRDMMQRLSLEQVEALVTQHPGAPEQAKSETLEPAADYIAGVLRQATAREQMKKASAPPPPIPPPYLPIAPTSPAPTAPNPAFPAAPATPAPTEPPWLPMLPGSPPPPPGTPPPAYPGYPGPQWEPTTPAPSRSITPIVPAPPQWLPPATERPTPGQSEQWQRITLAPGIELHYTITDDARFNDIVERLVQAATHILDQVPEKAAEES